MTLGISEWRLIGPISGRGQVINKELRQMYVNDRFHGHDNSVPVYTNYASTVILLDHNIVLIESITICY